MWRMMGKMTTANLGKLRTTTKYTQCSETSRENQVNTEKSRLLR
jgi:hypothetical protein